MSYACIYIQNNCYQRMDATGKKRINNRLGLADNQYLVKVLEIGMIVFNK